MTEELLPNIVGFLQPYSRYAYEGLRFELRSGALGASIKVGEFTRIAERTKILTRIKTECTRMTPRTCFFVMNMCAVCLSAIFQNKQSMLGSKICNFFDFRKLSI